MKYIALFLIAVTGCAVGVNEPVDTASHESVCATHTEKQMVGLACSPDAPDCAYDNDGASVAINPNASVAVVCHCIGGQYACFGRVPALCYLDGDQGEVVNASGDATPVLWCCRNKCTPTSELSATDDCLTFGKVADGSCCMQTCVDADSERVTH